MIQRNTEKPILLQTQMPTSKGQKKCYNEYEGLLCNHLNPLPNRITEEEKLQFFRSLLREDAIEYRQTIRVTRTTSFRRVLQMYRKETLEKISRKCRDGISSKMTPSLKLSDFLKQPKKQQKKTIDLKVRICHGVSVLQTPSRYTERSQRRRKTRCHGK